MSNVSLSCISPAAYDTFPMFKPWDALVHLTQKKEKQYEQTAILHALLQQNSWLFSSTWVHGIYNITIWVITRKLQDSVRAEEEEADEQGNIILCCTLSLIINFRSEDGKTGGNIDILDALYQQQSSPIHFTIVITFPPENKKRDKDNNNNGRRMRMCTSRHLAPKR